MRNHALSISASLLSVGLMFGTQFAYAAAGSLDTSFGNGGKVVTSLSNCGLSICNANPEGGAVLQPDGKIVVVKHSRPLLARCAIFLTAASIPASAKAELLRPGLPPRSLSPMPWRSSQMARSW